MTKVAILIDGSFFLDKLSRLTTPQTRSDPVRADRAIGRLVSGHLRRINDVVRADTEQYIWRSAGF